jgi:hypothetical protein
MNFLSRGKEIRGRKVGGRRAHSMEKVLEDSGIPQMPSTLRQFGQLLIRIWQLRLQQYACHTPLLLR